MEIKEIIELNEQNIRQALEDYKRYTPRTKVLDDISDDFIKLLAEDSANSKQGLRELFRKSPVWDEQLQALVINGTRTHDPDPNRITALVFEILDSGYYGENKKLTLEQINKIAAYFMSKEPDQAGLDIINELAPKAYAPGKKPSRVFKALCDALQISENTIGSVFQKLYAQLADELSAKKIELKLYASINPAHFLTMSNPKGDQRGATLTSCHSLNSTDYSYNCGCSGYARDENTFIVFTAADPDDLETLNNRKTTRQIFAYKPGNGVLLQSRLYNTFGGTTGAQAESKLYRDLIQREISDLEGAPNLWKTSSSCGSDKSHLITIGDGFGGYTDWIYKDFDGKISVREDRESDCQPITVGTFGLCISCGTLTNEGLYCDNCCETYVCEDCGETFTCDILSTVYDEDGLPIRVCERCRDEYYTFCDECRDWHPNGNTTCVGDSYICDDCLDEYYEVCDHCDKYERRNNMYDAVDPDENDIRICEACKDDDYVLCHECGRYVREDYALGYNNDKTLVLLCPECYKEQTSEEVAV